MYCSDLDNLLQKYAEAETKEDVYIKRTLENVAAQFAVCDEVQGYYANVVTRDFCRIIEMITKQQKAAPANVTAQHNVRYQKASDLARDFYNYYRQDGQVDYLEVPAMLENGRRDLVNPTMKDYVARIYTFSGKKYLGEMFSAQELGDQDPVLFVYDNIELILATFKTRDEQGEIVKQRVNIRSALRKLNEFKQCIEKDVRLR